MAKTVAANPEGIDLIPSQGTKIQHSEQCGQKKKNMYKGKVWTHKRLRESALSLGLPPRLRLCVIWLGDICEQPEKLSWTCDGT